MKVKRNDVAKAAGVSGATVSYVLNGTKRVSPEVEKRVLEAAKELNYVPNRIAQTLVGRRSNSIAIMTNDITNVYQVEVIKGLQEAALANDYIVYVFDAFGNIDKYLQHIVSRQVDGLFVVAAPDALPDEKLAELRDSGIKVLADYSRGTFVPGVSYIMSDLKGGVERAINYLYRMGHRKIGYLSGFDDACYYDIRLSSFREAMRKLNLDDTAVQHDQRGGRDADEAAARAPPGSDGSALHQRHDGDRRHVRGKADGKKDSGGAFRRRDRQYRAVKDLYSQAHNHQPGRENVRQTRL